MTEIQWVKNSPPEQPPKCVIHAISDLHGMEPQLPGGDLLIIAGDCTAWDTPENWSRFDEYLSELKYEQIILVPGNHDGALDKKHYSGGEITLFRKCNNVKILIDELFVFRDLRIYGFPWTPVFCNWHFMKEPSEMRVKIRLIPEELDILVSHGPPYGILDTSKDFDGNLIHVGCHRLKKYLFSSKVKYHVFGHIHECSQLTFFDMVTGTLFMNVGYLDSHYGVKNADWFQRIVIK